MVRLEWLAVVVEKGKALEHPSSRTGCERNLAAGFHSSSREGPLAKTIFDREGEWAHIFPMWEMTWNVSEKTLFKTWNKTADHWRFPWLCGVCVGCSRTSAAQRGRSLVPPTCRGYSGYCSFSSVGFNWYLRKFLFREAWFHHFAISYKMYYLILCEQGRWLRCDGLLRRTRFTKFFERSESPPTFSSALTRSLFRKQLAAVCKSLMTPFWAQK